MHNNLQGQGHLISGAVTGARARRRPSHYLSKASYLMQVCSFAARASDPPISHSLFGRLAGLLSLLLGFTCLLASQLGEIFSSLLQPRDY